MSSDTPLIFKNRTEAGRELAQKLLRHKNERPLVLALPRGGVPVGYEVACALGIPLDTVVVRKIGAPSNPEFGIGAIAPGDVLILNRRLIKSLGVSKEVLDGIIAAELKEMQRRILHYHSDEYTETYEADTVIIVDDGLATGITAEAAVESVKIMEKPEKIVFATPVSSRDAARIMRGIVDEFVCISEVDDLIAIGNWYEDFEQVSDEEVVALLKKANPSAR